MSLSGQLGTFSLVDLLQLIDMGGHSGRLILRAAKQEAGLSFYRGRIFSAWGGGTPRIGELLVDSGVLDAGTLDDAIRIQGLEEDKRPLGQILVEAGGLTSQELCHAVETHIKKVIGVVTGWVDGSFSFEASDSVPTDDASVLPADVVSSLNLDTQAVLLDVMRAFDERGREEPVEPDPELDEEEWEPDDEEEDAVRAARSHQWVQRISSSGEHRALAAAALCHQFEQHSGQLEQAIVACMHAICGNRPVVLYRLEGDGLEQAAVYPVETEAPPEIAIDRGQLFSNAPDAGPPQWSPALTDILADFLEEQPQAVHPVSAGSNPHGILVVLNADEPTTSVAQDVLSLFLTHVEIALTNSLMFERLGERTLRDPLTDLFNERYFTHRLGAEVALAQRHGYPLSILIVDIDHLKKLNETVGRTVGDQVLAYMAELIRSDNRSSDVGARGRQAEFLIMLPSTPWEGANVKAERLRSFIETLPFPGRESQPDRVLTASVAVVEFPTHAGDARGLMSLGRRGLYAAKQGGRNKVQVGDPARTKAQPQAATVTESLAPEAD
jgi:diguanylate cyclase (GGDEF)-like protein